MLISPALHTDSLVGLGLVRLTDKRQGFLAKSPRSTDVKVDPES